MRTTNVVDPVKEVNETVWLEEDLKSYKRGPRAPPSKVASKYSVTVLTAPTGEAGVS